jgi:hypothetical protein
MTRMIALSCAPIRQVVRPPTKSAPVILSAAKDLKKVGKDAVEREGVRY